MAVYQPKKVTAMPGSPTANTVYFVKNVGDSRIQMYVTDTSGTAFPVGILTENDVLGTSLAGFSTGSDIALSSSDTIIQAFQKVQGQLNALSTSVSQGMKVPLPLDCSTEPNYPAAEAGDSYKVTVAGKIGGASGPLVQVGDVITALTDNGGGTEAAVGTQWFILQANTDNATESVTGLTRIATQAEVNTGSEAFAYVTPLTLDGKLGDYVPESRTITINESAVDLSSNIDLGRLVSGSATSGSPSGGGFSGDLNSVKHNSIFYALNSATNSPTGSNGVVFKGVANAQTAGYEFFGETGSDDLYVRGFQSDTYNNWQQLAFKSWVNANFNLKGDFAENIGRLVNSSSTNFQNDLNDTINTAIYQSGNTATNSPNDGNAFGVVQAMGANGGTGFRFFGRVNADDEVYFQRRNGSWGTFYRVASREWVTANYQSVGNYVTLDTAQSITESKTFTKPIISSFVNDLDANDFTNIYAAGQGVSYFGIGSSSSNYPSASGHVLQWGNNLGNSGSDRFSQLYAENANNEWYLRRINQATNRGWNRIWHSGNFDPSSYELAGKSFGVGLGNGLSFNTVEDAMDLDSIGTNTVIRHNGNNLNAPVTQVGMTQTFTSGVGGSSIGWQNYFAHSLNEGFYYRSKAGGTWSSWSRVASREWVAEQNYQTTLTNPVTGTGVAGAVAFWNDASTVGGSTNLIFDEVNNSLFIGGTGGAATLKVGNNQNEYHAAQSSIYTTGSSGAGYPFNNLGHLVIQSRGNTARDILFSTFYSSSVDWRWRITAAGIFESNGTQTIRTSSGQLTLASNGGNGNISLIPNGTGQVYIGGTIQNAAGDFATYGGSGALKKRTAAQVLSDIGGQVARSITSSAGTLVITGGSAGSATTNLEMQWGAADW